MAPGKSTLLKILANELDYDAGGNFCRKRIKKLDIFLNIIL